MILVVNGQTREVASETLASLLAELEFEGTWLATAVNSSLVRSADRSSCRLNEGDRVEILSPRQGG
jgi:sulfur carrier protein